MVDFDVKLMEKIFEGKKVFKQIVKSLDGQVEEIKRNKLVGSSKVIAKIKLGKKIDSIEENIKKMNFSISGFNDLEKYQRKYFNQIRERIKKL